MYGTCHICSNFNTAKFQFHFRRSNIMIGLVDEKYSTEDFTFSYFYYYDDLTWCVQQAKPHPIWRNFFIIFSDSVVWSVLAFSFIAYTSVANILQGFISIEPKWDFHQLKMGLPSFLYLVHRSELR